MFKLILADYQAELCREFAIEFADYPEVEVYNGPFEHTNFDCVVSAANSFGLMDGGVDGAITMMFGQQLMDRVQDVVLKDYWGEQPVGTSFLIRATEEVKEKNQYVAHTPTMRIPLDIRGTSNVYSAMKAMLIEVQEHNDYVDRVAFRTDDTKIDTVVCTGLGTLTGNVPYKMAASEMAKAYKHFLNPPTKIDWDYAVQRHREIVMNNKA